jgi:hypothetical protein
MGGKPYLQLQESVLDKDQVSSILGTTHKLASDALFQLAVRESIAAFSKS